MPSRPSQSPPARRVALQRRDLDVLEALVLSRAEPLDEIHHRFFGGLSRKRAVNRLAQLARAGYLQPADVYLHGEDKTSRVYTLGPKARTALERRSLSSEHFRFRRWNPTLRDASIPHQVVVNRLGRSLGLYFLPEHLLPVIDKNGARNRPDAVVEGISKTGETRLLGFEIDLGHYSRERILAKHKAWQALPDTGPLLFVVPDDARAQKLCGWLGNAPGTRVLTVDALLEEARVTRERFGGLLFELDVWEGGQAWQREHERRRQLQAELDATEPGDV